MFISLLAFVTRRSKQIVVQAEEHMDLLLQILSLVFIIILFVLSLLNLFFHYDYTWLFKTQDVKDIEKIPGPKTIPYFGNILMFNVPHEDIIKEYIKVFQKYGPLVRLWVVGYPGILMHDPDDVEAVLSNTTHITKSSLYLSLTPWLCTGLLTSTGDKWHFRRKLLTSTFHFKILEQYIQVFNNKSAILVNLLEKKMNQPYVAINDMIGKCTLDIICESILGISIHAQTEGNVEYVNAVKRATELVTNRTLSPWLYRDLVYYLSPQGREMKKLLKLLHGFTEKIIQDRKEENSKRKNNQKGFLAEKKRKRLAFLDLLLEIADNEGVLTDSNIREEVDTFLFEGHDTTSMALIWALLLLGCHSEVQEKVADELLEIFGDTTREATFDDLQKMTYLEMVIKESLRLYPSVPVVGRILSSDVNIRGYRIPAGVEMVIPTIAVHKNPKAFPNPNKFNPDRFLPENVKNRHPFVYIPFSAGPRNCIGQKFALLEEKVVLSSILRRFKIESLDNHEDIPALFEITYRPKSAVRLKLSPRLKNVNIPSQN